jgi:hypothetical protein
MTNMVMRFVERAARSIPDSLATRIRRHVEAKFERNEQTVLDYGHYAGWHHSHYACDVNQPATRDPELLALLERASEIYRRDVVEFARDFEQGAPRAIDDVQIVSAFVTRYLPGDEKFDDHDDLCDVSLVVELSDADYEGGGVVGSDGTPWTRVRLGSGERGSAVIIGRGVWHKTIPMTSGVRWALVVFYRYV